ncbi:MAG: hypothetical protein LDL33_04510 [Desulfomonile sp.]|nr:hypothetical protein [Desulfomonile sp.]
MHQRKRTISPAEFVKDFFAGLTDAELIEKYRLTPSQLRHVFRAILDMRLISPMDFESWQIFHNLSVPLRIRLYPRTTLTVPPPIYEASTPSNRGVILNFSEYGIGVKGLHATLDSLMNLAIPTNSAPRARPITIQARCKWIAAKTGNQGPASGFYVVVVNETSWAAVRRALEGLGAEADTLGLYRFRQSSSPSDSSL